jgi:hypothetical protein
MFPIRRNADEVNLIFLCFELLDIRDNRAANGKCSLWDFSRRALAVGNFPARRSGTMKAWRNLPQP